MKYLNESVPVKELGIIINRLLRTMDMQLFNMRVIFKLSDGSGVLETISGENLTIRESSIGIIQITSKIGTVAFVDYKIPAIKGVANDIVRSSPQAFQFIRKDTDKETSIEYDPDNRLIFRTNDPLVAEYIQTEMTLKETSDNTIPPDMNTLTKGEKMFRVLNNLFTSNPVQPSRLIYQLIRHSNHHIPVQFRPMYQQVNFGCFKVDPTLYIEEGATAFRVLEERQNPRESRASSRILSISHDGERPATNILTEQGGSFTSHEFAILHVEAETGVSIFRYDIGSEIQVFEPTLMNLVQAWGFKLDNNKVVVS